jgi:hypothetical protein
VGKEGNVNPAGEERDAPTLAPRSDATGDLSVLVIGDLSHPELVHVLPCLEGICRWSHLPESSSATTEVAAMDVPPDLIVFAQARPGELCRALIDELRSHAPLSGACVVLGSQCEGESRTGRPVAGMPRVFWHQWPAFWQEQQARLLRGQLPAWTLPATASDEERLLYGLCTPHVSREDHRTELGVVILAESPESAGALADAVKAGGHPAEIWSANADAPPAGAFVVLWDAPPAELGNRRRVQAIQRQFPEAGIVGIATFPRFQDRSAALSAGLYALIAKPFRLEHLLAEIERLLTSRARQIPCE